jgi:hypothetical protein
MKLILTTADGFIFNFNRELIQEINDNYQYPIQSNIQDKNIQELLNKKTLIFLSYYLDEPVIKTIILPEGEIVQQIADNYLLYPELVNLVTQSHYRLIAEILSLQPVGKQNKLNKILLLFMIVLILVLVFYLLLK